MTLPLRRRTGRGRPRALACCLLLLPGGAIAACGGGSAEVGSACTEKEQCGGGLCLQAERYDEATGWPEGYCTAECEETCDELSTCVDLGSAEGQRYCVASCAEDAECRAGYVCNPWWSACLPDCATEGFDCGTQLICGEDGHCIDPEVDDGGGTLGPDDGVAAPGEPCEGPGSCVSGYICNPWARVCLEDCRALPEDSCPPTEVCAPEGFCHLPPPPPQGGTGGGGHPPPPPPP